MIKIGKINNLRVVKKVDFGIYLDGGDAGEILLPNRYILKELPSTTIWTCLSIAIRRIV